MCEFCCVLHGVKNLWKLLEAWIGAPGCVSLRRVVRMCMCRILSCGRDVSFWCVFVLRLRSGAFASSATSLLLLELEGSSGFFLLYVWHC